MHQSWEYRSTEVLHYKAFQYYFQERNPVPRILNGLVANLHAAHFAKEKSKSYNLVDINLLLIWLASQPLNLDSPLSLANHLISSQTHDHSATLQAAIY